MQNDETDRNEDMLWRRYVGLEQIALLPDKAVTVVLVHGWACSYEIWAQCVEGLRSEFSVVLVQVARERLTKAEIGRIDTRFLGECLAKALVRSVSNELVLVGHSFGGRIVLEAAPLLADRVRGIIAVNSLRSVRRPGTATRLQQQMLILGLRVAYPIAVWIFVSLMFSMRSSPATRKAVRRMIASTCTKVGRATLVKALRDDMEVALKHSPCPIIAINEPRFCADEAELRAAQPLFEVRRTSVDGHFPMLEEPAGFLEMLRQSVRDLATGRSEPRPVKL